VSVGEYMTQVLPLAFIVAVYINITMIFFLHPFAFSVRSIRYVGLIDVCISRSDFVATSVNCAKTF
jgi:hypothetical protein